MVRSKQACRQPRRKPATEKAAETVDDETFRAQWQGLTFKQMLERAPLEGVDLERVRDFDRPIDFLHDA